MNPMMCVSNNRLSESFRNIGGEFRRNEKREGASWQSPDRQEIFASIIREVAVNSRAKSATALIIKNICIRFAPNGDIKENGTIAKHYVAVATNGIPFTDRANVLSALKIYQNTDDTGTFGAGLKAAAYCAGYLNFDDVELLIISKKDAKGKQAVVGRMRHNPDNNGTYICEIFEGEQYVEFLSKHFSEFESMSNFFLIRYQWVEKTKQSDCGLCHSDGMSLLAQISHDINEFASVRFVSSKIFGHFNSIMTAKEQEMVKRDIYEKAQVMNEFKIKLEDMSIDGYVFDVLFKAKHYPNIKCGVNRTFVINSVRGSGGEIAHECGNIVSMGSSFFTVFVGGEFSIRNAENAPRIVKDPFLWLANTSLLNNRLGILNKMEYKERTNIERLRKCFEAIERFATKYKGKKDITSISHDERTFVEHNPKTVYSFYIIPKNKADNMPVDTNALFKWRKDTSVFFYHQLLSSCATEILKKVEAGKLPEFIKFRDEINKTFPPIQTSLPLMYTVKSALERVRLFSAENVGSCTTDTRLNKIDAPFIEDKTFKVFAFVEGLGFLTQEIKIDDEMGVHLHKTGQKLNGKVVYKLKVEAIELIKNEETKVPRTKKELLLLLLKDWKVLIPKRAINCIVDDQEYRLAIDLGFPTYHQNTVDREGKHNAGGGNNGGALVPPKDEDKMKELEQLENRRKSKIGVPVFSDFGRPEMLIRVNGPSYLLNLANENIKTMVPKLEEPKHKDFRIWFVALSAELDRIRHSLRRVTFTFTGAQRSEMVDIYGDDVESYVLNAHAKAWITFNRNFRANNLFHKRIDNVVEEEEAVASNE